MIFGQFGETYPPVTDGVGHVQMAYCRSLTKKGHTSYYVAPYDKNKTKVDGLETIQYPGIPIPGQPYRVGWPELSPAYRKKIKETDFDLVHAHAPFLAGWSARRIARRKNIPLVATFHTKYYDDMYEATHSKLFANWVVGLIVRFYDSCDEVWTVNENSAKVLEDYGYKGNIVIMPNGTDTEFMESEGDCEALKSLGVRDDAATFLYVGQISPKKNIEIAVRACGILKEEGMDFQFLMVGQGAFDKQLKEISKELGIEDDVKMLGFVSDRNVLQSLYRKADMVLFPSLYDTSSLVPVEAAVAGTPTAMIEGSTTSKGIEDGVNGFLCQNSPEGIAEKIKAALPAAAEVGKTAQRTIPLSWDDSVARAEERYMKLCEEHGKKK